MVHRYGGVLAGVMHKTPLYVHVQNQYSKKNVSPFSVLDCSCQSQGKKMEGRESGKEMPHP